MPRARENISLTPTDYDIAGNKIRAYYDGSNNLVFVLDETTDGDKPNVLLVIDSFDERKWDDVLANDYHVDLETVRPKRDNKYQKLDIEYGGLDVYAALIAAADAGDDLSDALDGLKRFRMMAVQRSARERLAASEETIEKSQETIERTKESISDLNAKIKELRSRISEYRKNIGREPTKTSAAKILKTEAQLDATNEKLSRAKKRLNSAQRRLTAAEDDAEIARAILSRDISHVPAVKKSNMPAVKKKQPVATVPQSKDEDVKPLFDKDPEILDDEIAFKPIDFGVSETTAPAPAADEFLPVVEKEEFAPAPLSFVPPVRKDSEFDDSDASGDQPSTPMLESLAPVAEPEPKEIESEVEIEQDTEPGVADVPIMPVKQPRPLSPVADNVTPADDRPQKSTLLYYIMLLVLIVLSIGTLWLYQKSTNENIPDLAKPVVETVAAPDVSAPAIATPEMPSPFVATANIVKEFVEEKPMPVPAPEPVVVESVPVVESVVAVDIEPEPIVSEPDVDVVESFLDGESPFITPEPVAYDAKPTKIPSASEVIASKPDYNVSQNEKMFVAAPDYESDVETVGCEGGAKPDSLGCCPGENYTYTDDGFMCCNSMECFPPME